MSRRLLAVLAASVVTVLWCTSSVIAHVAPAAVSVKDKAGDVHAAEGKAPRRVLNSVDLARVTYSADHDAALLTTTYRLGSAGRVLAASDLVDYSQGFLVWASTHRDPGPFVGAWFDRHHVSGRVLVFDREGGVSTCEGSSVTANRETRTVVVELPVDCLGAPSDHPVLRAAAMVEKKPGGADVSWDSASPVRNLALARTSTDS